MSSAIQEERLKKKLERKEESKRRYEARQKEKANRDLKLKRAYEKYRKEVAEIWEWWHSL